MTYNDLLKETAIKKHDAIAEINAALNGPCGFLIKAEIEKTLVKLLGIISLKSSAKNLQNILMSLLSKLVALIQSKHVKLGKSIWHMKMEIRIFIIVCRQKHNYLKKSKLIQ